MRQFIGITRFALLGPMGEGDFVFPHRKKPAVLSRSQWVHSPQYLAHRLMLWKALALPSIIAMQRQLPSGYFYNHLVAINPNLPNEKALLSTFPWFVRVVRIAPEERLEHGLEHAINALAAQDEYFTFRLDDDDALTDDYLPMVASLWERGHSIITPVEGYFIGANRRKPHLPLRMVPAVNAGSPHGIGAFNAHIHALGKHNAIPGTVGITGRVYWLRSVHRSNVTLAGHAGTPWGKTDADVPPRPTLERYFTHLSHDALAEALTHTPIR